MLLEGKNALIYGAGGSIGGAVARAFAREGASLHLAGRRLEPRGYGRIATGPAAATPSGSSMAALPLRRTRVTRSKTVGITPLRRVYDLRHTFATFALRAGISTLTSPATWAPA